MRVLTKPKDTNRQQINRECGLIKVTNLNSPSNNFAGDTKEIKLNHSVHAELEPSQRILLNIDIGGRGLKFLYDPESQYSMLPLNIFQQLAN